MSRTSKDGKPVGNAGSEIHVRPLIEEDIPEVVALWEEFMTFHEALDENFKRARDGSRRFAEFVRRHIAGENSYAAVADTGMGLAAVEAVEVEKSLEEVVVDTVVECPVVAVYALQVHAYNHFRPC